MQSYSGLKLHVALIWVRALHKNFIQSKTMFLSLTNNFKDTIICKYSTAVYLFWLLENFIKPFYWYNDWRVYESIINWKHHSKLQMNTYSITVISIWIKLLILILIHNNF